jgi:hypothetical protein
VKTTGVPAVMPRPAPEPDAEAKALIKEARRRQRRRYLAIGLAVIVVLAGAAGVAVSLRQPGHPPTRGKPGPTAAARPVSRPPVPAPIPASVDTTVLMWPAGYPAFGPGGGPPAYVDDLSTGRLSHSESPAISAGDWQPLLVSVGRWFVYVGDGVTAVRDDLKGMPRVLGGDGFFAPAATPDHVWLVHYPPAGPVSVALVAVTGGSPGQPITLPAGSQLIEGTDAGLLLDRGGNVELWNPGGVPRRLPFSAASSYGFDANAQLVAYGTGCRDQSVASGAPYEPQAGYSSCGMLRVFNVITGQVRSFPAPAGTTGWVPYEFNLVHPIAPGNSAIAAEAVIPSPYADTGRLYVLRLTASHPRPVQVPDSTGFALTKTAWSASGSWVFYSGPGGHMWAYQATTGRVRSSRTPCCQYTAMVAVRSPARR